MHAKKIYFDENNINFQIKLEPATVTPGSTANSRSKSSYWLAVGEPLRDQVLRCHGDKSRPLLLPHVDVS